MIYNQFIYQNGTNIVSLALYYVFRSAASLSLKLPLSVIGSHPAGVSVACSPFVLVEVRAHEEVDEVGSSEHRHGIVEVVDPAGVDVVCDPARRPTVLPCPHVHDVDHERGQVAADALRAVEGRVGESAHQCYVAGPGAQRASVTFFSVCITSMLCGRARCLK